MTAPSEAAKGAASWIFENPHRSEDEHACCIQEAIDASVSEYREALRQAACYLEVGLHRGPDNPHWVSTFDMVRTLLARDGGEK